jgi:hypothetical protein
MIRRLIVVPLIAVAAALVLWPAAGDAASRTQTLRIFDKVVSTTLTKANGTVIDHAPYPEPAAGDTLDVYSLDYRGTHAHHSKHWVGSGHLHCTFADGPPDCQSQTAIGGSLLVFSGSPSKLTDGTGIYQGATGRVISSKEVSGSSNTDVVAKIHLRR